MSAPLAATPLRVLHLNSRLTGGGTDDQCVKLVGSLTKIGVNAHLTGPDGREYSSKARELEMPFHPTPPEGPLKIRFMLHAARLIRRLNVQVVHGHHGRDLWPTILAARMSGRRPKVVLTRHMAKSPSSWFSRYFLLNRCDALIAVSEFVAKVLREGVYEPGSPEPERRSRPPLRGNLSRIHVLPGGVDTARFHPFEAEAQRREWGLESGQIAFAVVGGYDLPRGKGQLEFLQAAARIHLKATQARFLIVGRGSLEGRLRQEIAELKLEKKAWLTPYCREMPAAMNALDCLVHPQVGTEAMGMVILEAYACGKPVIASALDGIPEAFAVASYGRLVAPESVEELGAAMLKLSVAPRPDAAARAALHARVAGVFSLTVAAERVKRLYENLMKSPA